MNAQRPSVVSGVLACRGGHFGARCRGDVVATCGEQPEQRNDDEQDDRSAAEQQQRVKGAAAFTIGPGITNRLVGERRPSTGNEHDHERKRETKHASRSPHGVNLSHP